MTAANMSPGTGGIKRGSAVHRALIVEHPHFPGLQFELDHANARVAELQRLAHSRVKWRHLVQGAIDRRQRAVEHAQASSNQTAGNRLMC